MKKRILCLNLFSALLFAAPPSITKIEPPDWFTTPSPQPLLLVLSGTNLTGAKVTCPDRRLIPGPVETNAAGTHALFTLTLAAAIPPARYSCTTHSPSGSANFDFTIFPPLPPQGRFQGFSNDDVIYLIMPDRFSNGDPSNDDPPASRGLFNRANRRYYHGGDFAGIRARLPYLKDLGITALWLTPIYDNYNAVDPSDSYNGEQLTSYHGYGATDYYAVEEHFGTLTEYRQLIDAAHQLGLKVIQDHVANHVGARHPWLNSPPRPNWIHGTRENHTNETWQTWLLLNPNPSPLLSGVLDGWFGNTLPDLNQNDPLLSQYLIQNSIWWIARTGADAIREDTVPYAPRKFWRDWTAALHRTFPKLKIVGEVLEPDPALPAFYLGGRKGFDNIDTGLDSVFDFPLHFAIREVFAHHQSPLALAKILSHDSLYADPQRLVTLLGLHDTPRFLGESGATIEDLTSAFTFLFTTRGIPLIYYGDEIGMAGGDDPENRRDFPGGWPGDPYNAFTAQGRTPVANQLHAHVQKLIALRKSSSALRHGSTEIVHVSEAALAFVRSHHQERVLVVVHTGPHPTQIQIQNSFGTGLSVRCELGCAGDPPLQTGDFTLQLTPNSTSIYKLVP